MVVTVGFALALSACHQNGTDFVVDVLTDSVDADPGDGLCADAAGDCSLRAAVMEANAGPGVEEIVLADGATYVLSIAGAGEDAARTGDLDITEPVVITGRATVDGAGIDRIFDVLAGSGLVEIDGPDLTGGSADLGAALYVRGGAATSLTHSNVYGNTVTGASSSTGAPLEVDGGTLYAWFATIHDNDGRIAGGIQAGEGGTANVQNTTITGNTPFVAGAGGLGSFGRAVVSFSTIVGNEGFFDVGALAPGAISFRASIVGTCNIQNVITSRGHNVEAATTCGFTGTGDQQSTDPQLAPLADNGGEVLTLLPAVTSPAVDTTPGPTCAAFNLDARGLPRPAGPACDTGAVELR